VGPSVQLDLSPVLPCHPDRNRDGPLVAIEASELGKTDCPDNGGCHAKADPDHGNVAAGKPGLCRRTAEPQPCSDKCEPADRRPGNGSSNAATSSGGSAYECPDGDHRPSFNASGSDCHNNRDRSGRNSAQRRAGCQRERNGKAETSPAIHRGTRDPRTASAWDLLVIAKVVLAKARTHYPKKCLAKTVVRY
jgi:hypothetical protein